MARYYDTQAGEFPETSNEAQGGTAYPVYPVINEPAFQTNPNSTEQLGDMTCDKYGNVFLYVRCVAGLTVGQIVKMAGVLAGTVSASTTVNNIFTNVTTTINESSVGSFLASTGTAGGGGVNFLKLIKGQVAIGVNTTFIISKKSVFIGINKQDGDTLAAIPTTGDPLAVVRPYAVDVAGAAESPAGIALGTVTSGNRTLVQVGGLAFVSCVGNTDALVDNKLVTTAAAGNGKGPLAAGLAIIEVPAAIGIAREAYVSATAKLCAVQLWDLWGKW
jgi:hypothetical protein